jgi:hypothetical protein
MCHTCTTPVRVSVQIAARIIDEIWVPDHQTLAVETVGDDTSKRCCQKYRKLACESCGPQQQGDPVLR